MRFGIIGSEEFLGWHLRCYLLHQEGVAVVPFEEKFLKNQEQFSQWFDACDAIVIFFDPGSGAIAEKLFAVLGKGEEKPRIVFVFSSADILKEDAKGGAVETALLGVRQWIKKYSGKAAVITVPYVFGEFVESASDSLVAAYSLQLIRGEAYAIDRNFKTSLVYAQDVAHSIYDAVEQGRFGEITVPGRSMTGGEVFEMLKCFRDEYFEGAIPRLRDGFSSDLFSTFRSYLLDGFYPKKIVLKVDERGNLFEIVKDKAGGQTAFSLTKPGHIRGDHYHMRKIERFCVVKGDAEVRIRRLFRGETWVYRVRGDEPSFIDMPRFCTHNLKNTGTEDMLTVFWTSEIYNPQDPDTYRDVV